VKTNDFNYDLPQAFIAQTPLEPRHASRLMVMNRSTPEVTHTTFWHIGDHLLPGDLLVINETRVFPARLFGNKQSGGKVEILLLRQIDPLTWEVIVGGKGLTAGREIVFAGQLSAEIIQILDGSRRMIQFSEPVEPYLNQVGNTPLPPYIHMKLDDPQRYQTVYARVTGSAAAPTAGLHFTPELLNHLSSMGIQFAKVILHVGLDTFAPVTEEDPLEHAIHSEWCELGKDAALKINQAHRTGQRIIAVGTTSVRVLESAAGHALAGELVAPFSGYTSLFILPGHQFKAVDALITNFHLPRSSLIMLVSAFAGKEKILDAYRIAMQEGYRFYSFGDAMFIQ